jgi:RNase adaptor protein for sRNA GlmZ degradation
MSFLSTMPSQIHLTIISYAHRNGPLNPTPYLIFDIRSLPNPPRNLRQSSTGLSKRLRDEFFSDELVRGKFEACQEQLETLLRERTSIAMGKIENTDKSDMLSDGLTVGVCCEMGKHRSVAFVEELGRIDWGNHVLVDVYHRDVENAGGNIKGRKKEKHGREKGLRNAPDYSEDEGFGGDT